MNVVFMFPSQTSRYAGMIRKALGFRPHLRAVLDRAAEVLDEDLSRFDSDDPQAFAEKRDQRLGMFLVNYLYQRALEEAGIDAVISLGFSLGEYNHLVHIGALDFDQAVRLMVRPAPAGMPDPEGERAIVYRVRLATLEAIVARGSERGLVEVSGMLSPHIHLVVGEPAPVAWVLERLAEEVPSSRSMTFPVKLPLHSSLLEPVALRYAEHLRTLEYGEAEKPYLPNVLGSAVERPDKDTLVDLMTRHLYQPLRWRQSIDYVMKRYRNPVLVEVGPRRALCAFLYLEKRWHPKAKMRLVDSMKVDTPRILDETIRALGPEQPRFSLAGERFRSLLDGTLDPQVEDARRRGSVP